jgi:hypothetical protein
MSSIIDSFSRQAAAVIANPQNFARSKCEGIEKYVNFVTHQYFKEMNRVLSMSYDEEKIDHNDSLVGGIAKMCKNAVGQKFVDWKREKYIEQMVRAATIASLISVAVAGIFWVSAGASAGITLGAITFIPTAFGIHSYQMFQRDSGNIF